MGRTIQILLEDDLMAKAESMAKAKGVSVEAWVVDILRNQQFQKTKDEKNPHLGLFADIPEIMDEIVEEAYRDRRTMPMRGSYE